jgi:hypothetical protein
MTLGWGLSRASALIWWINQALEITNKSLPMNDLEDGWI